MFLYADSAVIRAASPTSSPAQRILEFCTVDYTTGSPLPDVRVLKENASGDRVYVGNTDASGCLRITLDGHDAEPVCLAVRKARCVPMKITWPFLRYVPDRFVLRLEQGVVIGGVIQDESGRPVKGAAIRLMIFDQSWYVQERCDLDRCTILTDSNGRWRCDMIPRDSKSLSIDVTHPDYLEEWFTDWRRGPSLKQLLDLSSVIPLKKGSSISGIVLDEQGRLVADATVFSGLWFVPGISRIIRADAAGCFQTEPTTGTILTVQSPRYAPELKLIDNVSGAKPIEFRLSPAQTLRGRIVDETGQPVAGALMRSDRWRDAYTLPWKVITGRDGRFEWKNAPVDEATYEISHPDYRECEVTLKASAEEQIVTLRPAIRVQGRVTDAETGKPIPRFQVFQSLSPTWRRLDTRQSFREGRYQVDFVSRREGLHVIIEADGYRPAVSPEIADQLKEYVFDVKFEKGQGPAGVVLLPDGNPAQNAQVIVSLVSSPVTIVNNAAEYQWRNPFMARTGPDGRFEFPCPLVDYHVVAIHEKGLAEIKSDQFKSKATIRLEPWGMVSGTAQIGREPAANRYVRMCYSWEEWEEPKDTRPVWRYETVADNHGVFNLERVRKGCGYFNLAANKSSSSDVSICWPSWILSGQTTRIQLGGTGRPVAGRLVLPKGKSVPVDWQNSEGKLAFKGEHSKDGQPTSFTFAGGKDGSFRVMDVPAGRYEISFTVYEPPKEKGDKPGEEIGVASQGLTVSEMNNGRMDEVLDIGDLAVTLWKRPQVGEDVPSFSATTVDEKPLKLADYRGRYVLLDFWATWCVPCVEEMPNLKKVYDAFGKDPRFVMISLSLDHDRKAPRQFAAKNDLKWIQGYLGPWSDTSIPSDYGVHVIPAIFLLDPEGRVIVKNLRGEAIMDAVKNALNKSATKPASRP